MLIFAPVSKIMKADFYISVTDISALEVMFRDETAVKDSLG